jgi:hypothetical protein
MMYMWPRGGSCFPLYKAFKLDADENLTCVMEKGKCKVAALGLDEELGPFAQDMERNVVGDV